jgi:hypothetical protein
MSKRKRSTATDERWLYSLWLDVDLKEGLAKVQRKEGVPAAEQIRRAVRKWLEAKGAVRRKEGQDE